MLRRKLPLLLLVIAFIGLSSCDDSPKKTVYYTITDITDSHDDGYKFSLRNQETGQPVYIYYPDILFNKGDELVMERTRKEVSFKLKYQ